MTKKANFIDVTLRDAHQCLWGTRMSTEVMTPIVSRIDRVGYSYINILGGAVFDVCVRYLQESPWRRIKVLAERFSTPPDGLTRGQSLYTFELFPDDIVALNAQRLAANGIRMFTIYDALNDNRNLESSAKAGRELIALGADHIGVKDATGLLTPEHARTLFPAIKQIAGAVPIQLHSHCQSGLAPEVYAEAIKAGFDFLQTMNMEHRLPEIMEEASCVRADLGYPIVVSPFAQYVVTQAVLNVVQGERYKSIPDEVRKYATGYYGRLAAPLAPEFLERARLRPEEMVTKRPGEHIAPWIPRLRKELGPGVDDEELLLRAFYAKDLVEPLKKPAPVYYERTSPLFELIRYLGSRRDIDRARIRFAGTEISFGCG